MPSSTSTKSFHTCPHEGCEKSKSYGYESDLQRKVCADHVGDLEQRENDAVINVIRSHKCEAHNRLAFFGYENTTHCHECRTPDMAKLRKLCAVENCESNPLWGVRDRNTGRGKSVRCETHKLDGDSSVGRILCKYKGEDNLFKCDVRATFKSEGINVCREHSGDQAIDTHRMCDHEECSGDKRAYFCELNDKGKPLPPTRCHLHRSDSMVPSDKLACINCGIWNVNIRDPEQKRICGATCKECLFAEFLSICDYNHIIQDDLDRIRQIQLSLEEIPKLKAKRDRLEKRLAKKDKQKRTEQLKEIAEIDEMRSTPNLKDKLEASLNVILRNIDIKINDPNISEKFRFMISKFSLFLKRKEGIIAMNLMSNSLEGHRVFNDRTIKQIGKKIFRRPDFYVQLEDHDLIIEIDEFSHTRHSADSELNRMKIMTDALGDRPLWIIRFNPDLYNDENGERHESLFNSDLTLKSQKRYEKAMADLNTQIEYCIDHIPDNFEVIYLRYSSKK